MRYAGLTIDFHGVEKQGFNLGKLFVNNGCMVREIQGHQQLHLFRLADWGRLHRVAGTTANLASAA